MPFMKAVVCEKYGPPEVLKLVEVEKPIPKSNEILVKVMATTVNSADVRIRGLNVPGFLMRLVMRLVLGFTGPRKRILGVVLAGIVEEVGDKVTGFKKGDQVYAATGFKLGADAEYITLAEKSPVTLKPTKASFEEAAALIFGGTTALYFLQKAGIKQRSGQKVLIYGASGAVGTAAVQIAKHFGADVTGVCSSENTDLVKSLGATQVASYDKEDFTKNGQQYDIIFDAVGKKKKQECQTSLVPGGKYVTVGGLDVASESKEQLQLLSQLYDNLEYKAVIDKTFPLEKIVEAHRYVDLGKKKGNVVITVSH